MSTAPHKQPIPVSDYLSGELIAVQKHEYVDGTVYAMTGATTRHNRIATNATGTIYSQLRKNPCQVFNSDMKIRVRQSRSVRFYYPDLSVVCQPNPDSDLFQDHPAVIVEVLSDSTRRVDEYEKREAYLTINSLNCYLMLEQDRPAAIVYRRGENGFQREDYEGLETVINLGEIGCQLSLNEVYDNVTFPEPDTEANV
ncbi:MAG TPA: Uma2 family endonuclease [Planctomycetaceae bacterium]|nr:Uma2 family endonuclease [Planctomycetaceae bacterium]